MIARIQQFKLNWHKFETTKKHNYTLTIWQFSCYYRSLSTIAREAQLEKIHAQNKSLVMKHPPQSTWPLKGSVFVLISLFPRVQFA